MTHSDGNSISSMINSSTTQNWNVYNINNSNSNNNEIISIIHPSQIISVNNDTFETIALNDESDVKYDNNDIAMTGEQSNIDDESVYWDEGMPNLDNMPVLSDFYLSALEQALSDQKNDVAMPVPQIEANAAPPNIDNNIIHNNSNNSDNNVQKEFKFSGWKPKRRSSVIDNIAQGLLGPNGSQMIANAAHQINDVALQSAYNQYNEIKKSIVKTDNTVDYDKLRANASNVAGAMAGTVYYAMKTSADYAKQKGIDKMAHDYSVYATQKAFEYSDSLNKPVVSTLQPMISSLSSVASNAVNSAVTNASNVTQTVVNSYKQRQNVRNKNKQQRARKRRDSVEIDVDIGDNMEVRVTKEELTDKIIKCENFRLNFFSILVFCIKEYLFEIKVSEFEKNVIKFDFDCLFDVFNDENEMMPIHECFLYYLNFLTHFFVSIDCQLKTYELFYLPFKMPIDEIYKMENDENGMNMALKWEYDYFDDRGRNSYNFSDRWNRFSHTISKAMNNYADDVKKIMTKDDTYFKKRLKFEHALGEKMGEILERIQIAIHAERFVLLL